MTTLTVEARFPTGELNAHDARGRAEWPPAPARLLAALLAAAHRAGRGLQQVEALFSAPAPVVTAPARGARDTGYGRWVPANDDVDLSGDVPRRTVSSNYDFMGKTSKAPERGSLVGRRDEDVVRWVFADCGLLTQADTTVLQEVAACVEYLGRPTSPVMLTVVSGVVEAPSHHDRWEPDPLGTVDLRVGTPALLRALDQREEQRRLSRFTGAHPPLSARPTVRYRKLGEATVPGAGAAVPGLARRLLDGAVLYRVRGGRVGAEDAPVVLQQLRDSLGEVDWMLPVLGDEGRGRALVQVLRAVLVSSGQRQPVIPVATRAGVRSLVAAEPASMTSLPRVMRALRAGGERWTTLVPTSVEDRFLEDAVRDAASGSGCRVVEAVTHDHACGPVGSDADGLGGGRHLTLVVDGCPARPLVLDGVMMAPVDSTGLAVNPRRRFS